MRNIKTFLFYLSLLALLGSCEKHNEDHPDFYDPEHRLGLWVAQVGPVKKDTLEFIKNSHLILPWSDQ